MRIRVWFWGFWLIYFRCDATIFPSHSKMSCDWRLFETAAISNSATAIPGKNQLEIDTRINSTTKMMRIWPRMTRNNLKWPQPETIYTWIYFFANDANRSRLRSFVLESNAEFRLTVSHLGDGLLDCGFRSSGWGTDRSDVTIATPSDATWASGQHSRRRLSYALRHGI